MQNETELPKSQYIDIDLGLKYLNGNKKLYIKVLNSFLIRYKHIDIYTLNENELKSTMHTIKGLSATLGMVQLSTLARTLYELKTEKLLLEFSKILNFIIIDLNKEKTKCILIVESNHETIDTLINGLENNYDILIATDRNDALESIENEEIDTILLNSEISNTNMLKTLKDKNISIIYITKPVDMNILLEKIQNI